MTMGKPPYEFRISFERMIVKAAILGTTTTGVCRLSCFLWPANTIWPVMTWVSGIYTLIVIIGAISHFKEIEHEHEKSDDD